MAEGLFDLPHLQNLRRQTHRVRLQRINQGDELQKIARCMGFALLSVVAGCASIVSGTQQSVSVVARSADNVDVRGAQCSLKNGKGEWFAAAPGSVTVHRSFSDLAVSCHADDWRGDSTVPSSTKGMAYGNILFGGLIGAGIDMGNGAAYDYPVLISVVMSRAAGSPEQRLPEFPTAAVLPVQPLVMPPLDPPRPAKPAPIGQWSFVVESLPESRSCSPHPIARISAKGPGVETYSVACSNGDVLAVRCEFSNCRALR